MQGCPKKWILTLRGSHSDVFTDRFLPFRLKTGTCPINGMDIWIAAAIIKIFITCCGGILMRKLRPLLIVLLVLVLFSGNVSAATYRTFNLTYEVDTTGARSMLQMINDWRTSGEAWQYDSSNQKVNLGVLPAYTYDYNLEQIALQRAYEVAIYFAHERPDKTSCYTCTYNGTSSKGECCAGGYPTAEGTFVQWQENNDDYSGQGHRRAMLSKSYTAIGIAHVYYEGQHYWVQEYGYKNTNSTATAAFDGTKTGSVKIDTDSAKVKVVASTTTYSGYYSTQRDLPEISAYYIFEKDPNVATSLGTFGKGIPLSSSEYTVSWKSNNTSIATIQNNSKFTFTGTGQTTLTATVTFGGKTYTTNVKVTGNAMPLTNSTYVQCSVANCDFAWTAATPKPVITCNGKTLVENTDYTITGYSNNTVAGTNARVTVQGTGNFSGTRSITFTINKANLSSCTLATIPSQNYAGGSSVTPDVTLTYKGQTLTKGTHYKLAYSGNTAIGTASVTITGLGSFEGERSTTFKIVAQSVSNLTISDIADQQYTGSEITPSLTIKNGSKSLTKGTDYTVEYSNNIEPGTASAKITGTGNYTGTRTVTFKVVKKQMSGIYCYVYGKTYTGSPITQTLTVKNGSVVLEEGTDYTVAYSNNTNVGTATITLTGIGTHYTGTKKLTFEITAVQAYQTSCTVTGTYTYTGSAIVPEFTLKYGDIEFKKGTDYTVTYSDNIEPGYGKINITGISSILTGTSSKSFYINRINIANTATVADIPDQVYTGSAIEPSVTVKYGSKTLVKDTDYTVSYYYNTNLTSSARVTITGTGHYSGTVYKYFRITGKPMSDATVSSISAQTYTGSAIKPSVTVKYNGTALTENTDYYLSYSNNTNAGTATVNVIGMGTYAGTKSVTFTISPKSASGVTVSTPGPFTYDGSAKTPTPTVKDGTKYLYSGTDYTIAYTGNKNAGTATATLTFKGNYTGTKSVQFTISPKSIAGTNTTMNTIADQTYTGSAITPAVTFKDGSKILTEGTDYTVTYTNNTDIGAASFTITGTGNYTGTKNGGFFIVAKSISSATVSSIADQTYTGSSIKPGVTVKDGSRKLVAGTDYTLSYSNNVNVGTATVTITGKHNYTGTISKTFKIIADTTGFTISSVGDQTYTGSAITPAFTVKSGSKTLTSGTDYTVAYSNNINVGTATITVTGKGNYSGTKTVNFKIVAKSISGATVSSIANLTYTGAAVTPSVTVKDGSKTLTSGTDYTVAYSNNINVGTATITVTGKGNYSGTKTVNFKIVAKSISGATVSSIANLTYTGAAVTPSVTVKDGSKALTSGTDYTIAYSNNVNAGTATVTVTGKGNYSGTKTANFTIVAKSISGATVSDIADQKYTGSAVTPSVTVKDGSKTLVAGTDYTVAYADNINAGTATVTVTGKGNYKGTKTASFNITEEAVERPDFEWVNEDGKWYLINKEGNAVTGFATVDGLTYYMDENGVMQTGWKLIDGYWYYFTKSGDMRKEWQKINNVWYYLGTDGRMLTGWQEIGGKWYYFAESGAMLTGWQELDGKWYYLKSSGEMLTGWQQIGNYWFYFSSSGVMQTGWQKIRGSWYYFKSNGYMATKWLQISGKWYWFGTNGDMAYSTSIEIDGKVYDFDANGVCTNP